MDSMSFNASPHDAQISLSNSLHRDGVLTQIRIGHIAPAASASWRTSRVDAASVRHPARPPRVPCTGSPRSESAPSLEMKSAPRFCSATCLTIQVPVTNRNQTLLRVHVHDMSTTAITMSTHASDQCILIVDFTRSDHTGAIIVLRCWRRRML